MSTTTFDDDSAAASGGRLRWLLLDSLAIARRSAEHIRQIPEKLLDVTLQPLMFVLLFAFVFQNVIAIPDGSYREYLMGGILVQTLAFGVMGPGVSIATDLGEGIIDRFRTLPMSRSAYLTGHLIAEFAATCVAITVISLTGAAIGWGIDASLLDAVAGFALIGLIAVTMLWLGTLIGVAVRSPDAVTGIVFIGIFPLTFLANVFVPLGGLSAGLGDFAAWNPISAMTTAVRTLFGNPTATPADPALPLQHPVLATTLWCAAILAVAVPLTIRTFNARTSG